jgi:hypothetical protein
MMLADLSQHVNVSSRCLLLAFFRELVEAEIREAGRNVFGGAATS